MLFYCGSRLYCFSDQHQDRTDRRLKLGKRERPLWGIWRERKVNMDTLNEQNLTKAEFISQQILDQLSLQAKQSTRLRKNYNFHISDGDICHRLLNAMEPDSYIQPHRHSDINKDETLAVIRGKMGLIIFDNDGTIKEKALLVASATPTQPRDTVHRCWL